jgi:Fur family zinc uptake transcriptional regulator
MKTMSKLHNVRAFCDAKEINITPLRAEILSLLSKNENPMSAYDLLRALRIKNPNAEPPTVYRVLEFFQEKNIVHRVDSNNTYLLCTHPETLHYSQVLICKSCNSTYEVEDKGLFNAMKKLTHKFKFAFSSDLLEIRGLCSKCA